MIAANVNATRIAHRQPPSSALPDIMPAKFSPTSSTGERNASPNAMSSRITRDRYSCALVNAVASFGRNPARIWIACGNTSHAMYAPPRNRGNAAPTNPYAYFFSFLFRPGVMNAHTWYSHQGQVMKTARNRDDLIFRSSAAIGPAKFSVISLPRSSSATTSGRWSSTSSGS
jgi:hypothetical protein